MQSGVNVQSGSISSTDLRKAKSMGQQKYKSCGLGDVVLALPEQGWVTLLGKLPVTSVSVSLYEGSVLYSREVT